MPPTPRSVPCAQWRAPETGSARNQDQISRAKCLSVCKRCRSPPCTTWMRSIIWCAAPNSLRTLRCVIHIDPRDLALVVHTDAAWGNARNNGTQAGYIIGFTHKDINAGVEVPWTPAVWRSYRLSRVVPSTLSGEAQALATGSATVEWMNLCISELLDGPSSLHGLSVALRQRPPTYVIDCKSLYDHVMAPSAPTTLDDKWSSIDIIIIRESLQRCRGVLRWVPTDRMLADVLTKNQGDPADLLRACMRNSTYQINEEGHLMAIRSAERDRRKQLKTPSPTTTGPSSSGSSAHVEQRLRSHKHDGRQQASRLPGTGAPSGSGTVAGPVTVSDGFPTRVQRRGRNGKEDVPASLAPQHQAEAEAEVHRHPQGQGRFLDPPLFGIDGRSPSSSPSART